MNLFEKFMVLLAVVISSQLLIIIHMLYNMANQ